MKGRPEKMAGAEWNIPDGACVHGRRVPPTGTEARFSAGPGQYIFKNSDLVQAFSRED
jgi:hypothetical protein